MVQKNKITHSQRTTRGSMKEIFEVTFKAHLKTKQNTT